MLTAQPGTTVPTALVKQASQVIPMAWSVFQVSPCYNTFHQRQRKETFHCHLIIPVEEENIFEGCLTDADCPSKEGCYSGDCKNPCLEDRPCVTNAICTVYDDLPKRTMTCVCAPGYTGKGDVRCDPIGNELLNGV